MKVKKQKPACVIENKWMMTSSTLMRPRRINNEDLKVSKKSKTLKKKMSIKKQKVLRSNAFRVVSQLTRKKVKLLCISSEFNLKKFIAINCSFRLSC